MTAISDIWMFHTGFSRIRRPLLEAGAARETCWLPVLCFLLIHPQGPVLVDTGFGRAMTRRRRFWWLRLAGAALRWSLDEGMDCRSRIEQCGVDPNTVRHGLLTHMHWDHTGALGELPETTFYVSPRELEFAMAQHAWRGVLSGYLPLDYAEATNLEPIEWSACDDLQPFDTCFDLFGDGAIRAFPTPGHSPGHLSIAVRHRSGREVLLTGDAAFTQRHVDSDMGLGFLPRNFAHDLAEAKHTLDRLRAFARRRDDLLILTSHDPDQGDDAAGGPVNVLDLFGGA